MAYSDICRLDRGATKDCRTNTKEEAKMLKMIVSLYRAFEEGLAYCSIAGRYEGRPFEMANHVRTALASRYDALVLATETPELVEANELEMVAA